MPQEVNSILFPQTAASLGGPNAGELSMLQAGALGIQWGGDGNPQYEVQVTNDINDESSWQSLSQPLPVVSGNETLFYRIKEITQDPNKNALYNPYKFFNHEQKQRTSDE